MIGLSALGKICVELREKTSLIEMKRIFKNRLNEIVRWLGELINETSRKLPVLEFLYYTLARICYITRK